MSSLDAGEEVDLEKVAGRAEGEGGVRHGDLLLALADAAMGDSVEDLDRVRLEISGQMGPEALGDAAAIVAIFWCNVRVADATGIPLDPVNSELRMETADVIGIQRFDPAGAVLV